MRSFKCEEQRTLPSCFFPLDKSEITCTLVVINQHLSGLRLPGSGCLFQASHLIGFRLIWVIFVHSDAFELLDGNFKGLKKQHVLITWLHLKFVDCCLHCLLLMSLLCNIPNQSWYFNYSIRIAQAIVLCFSETPFNLIALRGLVLASSYSVKVLRHSQILGYQSHC